MAVRMMLVQKLVDSKFMLRSDLRCEELVHAEMMKVVSQLDQASLGKVLSALTASSFFFLPFDFV